MSRLDLDESNEVTGLSPGKAFNALGNEIRTQILRTLGEADKPLTFSELSDRVGHHDSGNFNYHLKKLEGHFIRKTDEGYRLSQAGRRIVEAVFSGAVTEDPIPRPIEIERPCQVCGAPIEVIFHPGRVEFYCTECEGVYGKSYSTGVETSADRGYLGYLPFPPAGFKDRTPEEVYRAAEVWGNLEVLSMANGVCPKCSGPIEHSFEVCEEHDATDGTCKQCNSRYAVMVHASCTNCIHNVKGTILLRLFSNNDVLAFKINHGFNPVAPSSRNNPLSNFEEEILSLEPFEALYTFTYDGDELTLRVDDGLNVVDVIKSE